MLLLYLIFELAIVTLADPFHKYPYVFLLDIGNEEIEKTNTEQIRLTIPGGSLALKYPAIDDGDTIGHVRVSGIDFGTELKVNIVQGGPGYKYVVLVFMGKPGVSYDAVVTIQTVQNIDSSEQIVSNMDSGEVSQELEDDSPNDSAEDTLENKPDVETKHVYSEYKNAQKMQSSSNIYEYVSNEIADNENSNEDLSQNSLDDESEEEDEDEQEKKSDSYSEAENQITDLKNEYSKDENTNGDNHVYSLNYNRYDKYDAFKPIIIGGVRFYPQAAVYMQGGNSKPTYDQENHNNLDGDDDNDNNFKDDNNNDDGDYGTAVEY